MGGHVARGLWQGGGVKKAKNSRSQELKVMEDRQLQVAGPELLSKKGTGKVCGKWRIVEAHGGVGGHQGGGGEHHPGGAEGRARSYPNFQNCQQNFNKKHYIKL